MRESQSVIESWRAEGRAQGLAEGMSLGLLEAKRSDLLRALILRFQAMVPPDIGATIRAMDDPDQLDRWFDAALTALSFESFCKMAEACDAVAGQRR